MGGPIPLFWHCRTPRAPHPGGLRPRARRTLEFSSALPEKADFVGIGYYRSGRRVLAARTGDRTSFFDLSVAGRKLTGRPLIVPLPPDVVHGPSLIGMDGDRLVLVSDGRVFFGFAVASMDGPRHGSTSLTVCKAIDHQGRPLPR